MGKGAVLVQKREGDNPLIENEAESLKRGGSETFPQESRHETRKGFSNVSGKPYLRHDS